MGFAGLLVFFPALALERRVARWKLYRILRDCFRLLLIGLVPLAVLDRHGHAAPGGGEVLLSLLLVPFGYWLLKKIDRVVGAGGVQA